MNDGFSKARPNPGRCGWRPGSALPWHALAMLLIGARVAMAAGPTLPPPSAAPVTASAPAASSVTTGPMRASAAPAPPASVPVVEAPSGPERAWLRDEAEVFSPAQRERLTKRLRLLQGSTGCEIFVYTRVVPGFDGFEAGCENLFRTVVRDAAHYKIVLVVLGYEGTSKAGVGRGKVYTAIGAGLTHVLSKQKLEGFLAVKAVPGKPEGPGPKVTTDSVIAGVEDLAATLEGFFKRAVSAAATGAESGTAPLASLRLRTDLLAGIAGVILLVLLARRMTRCPQCGARLRKQVKILPAGAEGGSHAVRRTAKCFSCGYVRKGSLF